MIGQERGISLHHNVVEDSADPALLIDESVTRQCALVRGDQIVQLMSLPTSLQIAFDPRVSHERMERVAVRLAEESERVMKIANRQIANRQRTKEQAEWERRRG